MKPLFVRSVHFILLTTLLLNPLQVSASDPSSCKTLLESDEALLAALPPRIANMLGSEKILLRMRTREQAWTPLFEEMDAAIKEEGKVFAAAIDDLFVNFSLRHSRQGKLQLRILSVWKDGLEIGQDTVNGMQFFDLIAAQLTWLSKYRLSHKVTEFEIVGGRVVNIRLIELLKSLGFINQGKDARYMLACLKGGAKVGIPLGFVTGTLFSAATQPENKEELLRNIGGAMVIGTIATSIALCSGKKGNNHRLIVKLID